MVLTDTSLVFNKSKAMQREKLDKLLELRGRSSVYMESSVFLGGVSRSSKEQYGKDGKDSFVLYQDCRFASAIAPTANWMQSKGDVYAQFRASSG